MLAQIDSENSHSIIEDFHSHYVFITTKKIVFYDTHSKTLMQNRLRMSHGGNFVNKKTHSIMVL